MASSRRGTSPAVPGLPPVSALFLVDFDVKAGYTIAWKRGLPGLELEGLVEYKSLPSGLHTVTNDLIYFVHDGAHAGLSAFVNEPCDEEELRHARMIAVGVLVPLSHGRLGRAWQHAQSLKEMAATLVKNRNKTDLLEAFWDANRARDNPPQSPLSPGRDTRRRSATYGSASFPDHRLSPFHPAWSLTSLLDRFGPLIFPIHRAALLRQRILISCHAPVHHICDFVYDISLLSNMPPSLTHALPSPSPPHRLRPLFNIGVHDIPFLIEDLKASKRNRTGEAALDESGSGWIACTTDSILAMKDTLWDMLITMPPDHAVHAREPVWPVIECPRGQPVRATQRDLRRFRALRAGLARLTSPERNPPGSIRSSSPAPHPECATDRVVEPLSWAALAYNGFMWWASAGEQLRSDEQDEAVQDAALLVDDPRGINGSPMPSAAQHPPTDLLGDPGAAMADDGARVELAVIAYFHRLTTQMLDVVVGLVQASDAALPPRHGQGDDESLLPNDFEDPGANPIVVDSRSIEGMGLDVWSASDVDFVQQLVSVYFARQARIDGKGLEICGIRVC